MTEMPDVFGEKFRTTVERSRTGDDGSKCVVCGKPATRKSGNLGKGWFVRMDEGIGSPILWDDPTTVDGGIFPVGTECRKKFPAGYVGEAEAFQG